MFITAYQAAILDVVGVIDPPELYNHLDAGCVVWSVAETLTLA
jgi:hypothetical protein